MELYRQAAERVVGRTVRRVVLLDPAYTRGGPGPAWVHAALVGRRITGVDRHGKVLLLRTGGPTLGMRFGMTGRLVVDGGGPIDELHYGGRGDRAAWDRFTMALSRGSSLRVNDPRRLGSVELDPDLSALGPDVFAVGRDDFVARVCRRRAPVKAVLLDQSVVAGLGNMLADELLFRAGVDPAVPAAEIPAHRAERLWAELGPMLGELLAAGGSHLGHLAAHRRHRDGVCPSCGARLVRRTLGGRSTFSCPLGQA